MKSICQAAVLCARQDIGLRGHREHEGSANKGNFLEILDVVASEDTTLKKHMQDAAHNAKYVSKATRNEVLQAAADGASLSEPHTSELNGGIFYYYYCRAQRGLVIVT